MVHAPAPELDRLSVQAESVFGIDCDLADSKESFGPVADLSGMTDFGNRTIKNRTGNIPKLRSRDRTLHG